MNFQMILLIIAIIVLIICLIFIGIALKKTSNVWPPGSIPMCPDYFILDGSGNNMKCINTKKLGKCPPQPGQEFLTLDPNATQFQGSQGACNKYTFATKCGLSWDGITYGVQNPCNSS